MHTPHKLPTALVDSVAVAAVSGPVGTQISHTICDAAICITVR
eukprot:SAG31_NODE_9322_length_1292_cov_1.005004_1_plen_42_part_10